MASTTKRTAGKRQFGTIRKLPSGKWQARYRDPGSNQMVSAPATFTTKAVASRWLSSVEADVMRGVPPPRTGAGHRGRLVGSVARW